MKVGFDISQIAHQGGVATYIKNLAENLQEIKDLEMVYFYSSFRKPYIGKLKNVAKFKLPPTFFEILFNRWRNVDIEKFIGRLDIFHSSDWTQPPSKAKKVTTYHDVIPLKYPQWSHPKIISVHKRKLKLVEKEIDLVIAVSNATKKDLMEVSGIPEKKIIVIYEAAGEQYKPQSREKVEDFKRRMGLPDKFILAIGGIGSKRNLERVKETTKNDSLVIAGVNLANLDPEELPLLYAAAEMLLYPSFYEGFGLPILEAQACGCPVITSNVSSMPEVAGKGAILVDPNSTEDIIRGMREIREIREELIKLGFDNAKRFSWEKTSKETAEVYRRLMR